MKILLLAVLLGLVLSVDCRRRKPQRGGKHGLKKTKVDRCFIWNCKKPKCFNVRTCDQCNEGFMRVEAPLGFACARNCPLSHTQISKTTCVRACTKNCKKCVRGSCYVCDRGYVLSKGTCIRRCRRGYKLLNGKCLKQVPLNKPCRVMNCILCPKRKSLKCSRCKRNMYKLSATRLRDFCFSHCPSGYAPKTVNGVNICKKDAQPYTKGATVTTPEHTPEPEFSTLEQTAVPTAEPEIYTTDSWKTETYTLPEELWP